LVVYPIIIPFSASGGSAENGFWLMVLLVLVVVVVVVVVVVNMLHQSWISLVLHNDKLVPTTSTEGLRRGIQIRLVLLDKPGAFEVRRMGVMALERKI